MICSDVLINSIAGWWLGILVHFSIPFAAAIAFLLAIVLSFLGVWKLRQLLKERNWTTVKSYLVEVAAIVLAVGFIFFSPYVTFLGLEYVLSFGIGPMPALCSVDCASERCELASDTACTVTEALDWLHKVAKMDVEGWELYKCYKPGVIDVAESLGVSWIMFAIFLVLVYAMVKHSDAEYKEMEKEREAQSRNWKLEREEQDKKWALEREERRRTWEAEAEARRTKFEMDREANEQRIQLKMDAMRRGV